MKMMILLFGPVLAFAAGSDISALAANGDWAHVSAAVGANATLVASAEGRLLKAHAGIAANDADVGVCGFGSATTEPDRAAWKKWTETLVANYPASTAAHYLHGDALARGSDFAGAQAVT